ncbi:N alpha-acetyl-transferase [Maudiozyma exigua]|uniref:N alpha-acetyl-transferase n=1 Tax=Maudiozyma exigua TaxID=34358 RepID=A0A9P6VY46_MAUEX|nr:N alpha-acetyl-transferase [Kazachstania exigua]
MNEADVFEEFLSIIIANFPEQLQVKIENETHNLQRCILFMNPKDTPVQITNDVNISEYRESKNEHNEYLAQLLSILDQNLGSKYKKVSSQIYENHKSWRDNKLEEMKTPGLIHVGYKLNNEETLLYMSFMLTNETGCYHEEDVDMHEAFDCSVIYLYEIQILSQLRRQGLGKILLNEILVNCGKEIYSNRQHSKKSSLFNISFIGIELTVFSDNISAIKFYEYIGMKLTPWSPQDELITIESRITRSQRKNRMISNVNLRNSTRTITKKPIYYLYYYVYT